MSTNVPGALIVAILALAGCATTPMAPLSPTHPASPEAVEGPVSSQPWLGGDEPTERTSRLLAGADPGAEPKPTPMESMESMPGTNH
ncbi:MAG: hypothetical protein WA771_00200 [Chthoniobacterales bacterium]